MEIYCKDNKMLDKAISLAEQLQIADEHGVTVYIKRLPPSFKQKGIIEFPRYFKEETHIDIYIKYDSERYVTLAHEMVHLYQMTIIKDPYSNHNKHFYSFTEKFKAVGLSLHR